jgi:hypothetical protein
MNLSDFLASVGFKPYGSIRSSGREQSIAAVENGARGYAAISVPPLDKVGRRNLGGSRI